MKLFNLFFIIAFLSITACERPTSSSNDEVANTSQANTVKTEQDTKPEKQTDRKKEIIAEKKKDENQQKFGKTTRSTQDLIDNIKGRVNTLSEDQIAQIQAITSAVNFDTLSSEEQESKMYDIRKAIIKDVFSPEQLQEYKDNAKNKN